MHNIKLSQSKVKPPLDDKPLIRGRHSLYKYNGSLHLLVLELVSMWERTVREDWTILLAMWKVLVFELVKRGLLRRNFLYFPWLNLMTRLSIVPSKVNGLPHEFSYIYRERFKISHLHTQGGTLYVGSAMNTKLSIVKVDWDWCRSCYYTPILKIKLTNWY